MTMMNPFVKWISSVDLLLVIMFVLVYIYICFSIVCWSLQIYQCIAFDGIYVFKRVKLILKLLNFF